MQKLSEAQLDWVFAKCLEFVKKWNTNIPKNDHEWSMFQKEYNELFEKSRGTELMKDILINCIDYISFMSNGRPALGMVTREELSNGR